MDEVTVNKFALYARKSTEQEDRQVLSIPSQVDELNALSESKKAEILSESASAKGPGRKVFNEMIQKISAGEIQGIIAWHPDRLSRNSLDTGMLIHLMDQGKLLKIVTPSQTFTNTPNDKFLFNLLCSQAKYENDNKGVNVKRGLRKKVKLGWYPGPAKIGYKNNPSDNLKGEKDIGKDPERWPLLRKAVENILSGETPLQVLNKLNNEWHFRTKKGKPLARSTFYRVLTDTFYYGEFEYPKGTGDWYIGSHDPLMSVEEYDLIQTMLGRKGKARHRKHNFAYTGLIRCGECGASVTAEKKVKRQKNGNVHTYIYYHCTKRINPKCTQKSIEQKNLESQVQKTLDSVQIAPEFHKWALEVIKHQNQKESDSRAHILDVQQKDYNRCLRRIDNLIDMRANDEINEEQFRSKMRELEKEKKVFKQKLDSTDHQADRWYEFAQNALTFARDASTKFQTVTPEVKAGILSALGSNLVLKDKKLHISVEKPLLTISKSYQEVFQTSEMFEPLQIGLNKYKTDTFNDVGSIWLRGWDSNPRPIG